MSASNDCGCCEGLTAETPVEVNNRPGLSAIAYRAGTHAQFKATLLARLSTARLPALDDLTTREDDDFTIALLDAWAAVCDVLTFYQERIANENYFRTATELQSIINLARLIDYHLLPGVAASVNLAFTLETAPGALGQALGVGTSAQATPTPPLTLKIDPGIKVQSIPGAGESAQTFETVEPIDAQADWNAIQPRLRQPQVLSTSADSIFLQGTLTNLKRGDMLLIAASASDRAVRKVLTVTTDDNAKTTRVDFETAPAALPPYAPPSNLPHGTVDQLSAKQLITAALVASQIIAKTWTGDDLAAVVAIQGWDPMQLATNVAKQVGQQALSPDLGVFVLRQHAAIFGHNAPRWESLSANLRFGEQLIDAKNKQISIKPAFPSPGWEGLTLDRAPGGGDNSIFLDNIYPGITAGSWAAITGPAAPKLQIITGIVGGLSFAPRRSVAAKTIATGISSSGLQVSQVNTPTLMQVIKVLDNVETSRADFAISAKVSRLTIQFAEPVTTTLGDFTIRDTTVLAQSEQLTLSDIEIPDLVQGDTIVLDSLYLGLKAGQFVILTGERNDLRGAIVSELLVIKNVTIDAGFTALHFKKGMLWKYVRRTVTINANVGPATHGETVKEVLGSGDGTQSFQQFTLRQPPLTYVSSSAPSGATSTLEIRVNDLLWKEVPTFFQRDPDERIYVTRTDDQGNTTVTFGDGVTGARLPTGAENIRANYRKGIGLGGNLPGDRLTLLLTRPLGLKGVTNPLAASGGSDREKLADARTNAPLAILTLGRIVSLQDYEDFARAFAGIGKALATWDAVGDLRGVFLTVAGSGGAPVTEDSELYKNLLSAIFNSGDPTVPFTVKSYRPRYFRLSAGLQVDPIFDPDLVVAAVTQALRDMFSFDARAFGQPVILSEVVTTIQNVKGVFAVDLTEMYRADGVRGLSFSLPADTPSAGTENPAGAELLTLDTRPIGLEVLP